AGFVGHPCALVAVDALCAVVLERRTNQCGITVAAERETIAEPVAGMDGGWLDVGLLHPGGSVADEHVRGAAGGIRRLVVAANCGAALHDACTEAVLVERSDENRIAIVAQHIRDAERISVLDVRRLQIIGLLPHTGRTGEDIHRASAVAARETSPRVGLWRSRRLL